jgi:hypothetical protein
MPREVLRALNADVRRLLAAGGATAPADEGLRRRAEALRELGRKVPALAQVTAAVERVTGAQAAGATAPLLDLLVLLGQVRAGLAGCGLGGAAAEVAPGGPWATDGAGREVYQLLDALALTGKRRASALEEAAATVAGDLRLLQPLLSLWTGSNTELSDLLAVRVLPQAGLAVLPELWRALCRERRQAGLRLLLICRSHPLVGLELCRLALAGDDLMLRESAISAIGQVRDNAAPAVPPLVRGLRETAGADRATYARALGKIGPAAWDAVPALCDVLQDESDYVRIAAAEALGHIRSPAALPALRAVASNPSWGIRHAAVCAIGRIGMPWGKPHQ